jgi:predicted metalloprotease
MSFNPNSRLNPSQVQDRRGRSMGRGARVAMGGGIGGVGLIILVLYLLLGGNPGDLASVSNPGPYDYAQDSSQISDLASECQTGADANARTDCAIVGYVNSIQTYWSDVFAGEGIPYSPAQTVLYSGYTEAACGYAQGAMGPFYCQLDQNIYLDLSFFDELQYRFGGQGGPLAVAYVLAHEYSHHIQDLLGLLDTSGNTSQSMSIYTELQADCLAGVWLSHAVDTGYLLPLTDQQIAQALDAAAAVGDDRIQSQTQGYVSPENWTHGSSDQRYSALLDGIQSGNANTCETPGWME